MIDRLLIFNRNWECIYDRRLESEVDSNITSRLSQISLSNSLESFQKCFGQVSEGQTVDDESKLLIGTIYSLQKVLVRMIETSASEDSFGFDELSIRADNDEICLHYYETPTKLRFLVLIKALAIENQDLLKDFYREVFVPIVCRNPLILRTSDMSFTPISHLSAFKSEARRYFKAQLNPK